MKSMFFRRSMFGAIAFAAICATATSPAHAQCRTIESVQTSADPDLNTAMGGHMTAHILGMRPPAGQTQRGRTLFSWKGRAEDVWRQYQYIPNPVNCAGGAASQTVPVGLPGLGMGYLDAFSCTAANPAGECTSYNAMVAALVFFGFRLDGRRWILNTMFPEPLKP